MTLDLPVKSSGKSQNRRRLLVEDGERRLPSAQLSNVDLFSDTQRVFQLNAKISNCAVDLGVAEQKLYRAQIAGFQVDQCRFGASEGMRAVTAWIQTNRRDPIAHQARVLSCLYMRSFVKAAWEKKSASKHLRATYPGPDGLARVLRNLELDRPLGLALDNRHAFADPITNHKISDIQTNEVAASQLAIDRKIEECQVPEIAREFKPGADGPNLLREKRAFLTDKAPLVPRRAFRCDGGKLNFGQGCPPPFPPSPGANTASTD